MGCPLCKDHPPPPPTGHPTLDLFMRTSSGSLRSSRHPTTVTTRGGEGVGMGMQPASFVQNTTTTLYHHQPIPTNIAGGIQQQNCKLGLQQPLGEEPPLYFLSGAPALNIPGTPPRKAPRTSGWREATLQAAADESASADAPTRPPRRHTSQKTDTPTNNTSTFLQAPSSAPIGRSTSSNSLNPGDLVIPAETAAILEEYLRKNESYSALHILMSQLQAQGMADTASLAGSSTSGEEDWKTPDAPILMKKPLAPQPLTTPPIKGKKVAAPVIPVHDTKPSAPIRKKRSLEDSAPALPLSLPPPVKDNPKVMENAGDITDDSNESLVFRGHWEDRSEIHRIVNRAPEKTSQIKSSDKFPTQKSPTTTKRPFALNLGHLSPLDENPGMRPLTPGPWFDRGNNEFSTSPSPVSKVPPIHKQKVSFIEETTNKSLQELHDQQITPPPSENYESEENEEVETTPKEVTHSILLKVLQQFSDDFGSREHVTRRGSIAINHLNLTMDGLHEVIKTLQDPALKEEEEGEEEGDFGSPSLGELESALADLLHSEKVNEREIIKEQKVAT